MATQAEIADFVARRITIGRVQPGDRYYLYRGFWAHPYYGAPLPTVQQIAHDLLTDGEFQGLRLGGFFNTPTGEFLEQAVEIVLPGTVAPEFELIVGGLKLAADWQRRENWTKALLSAGGAFLAGVVLREIAEAA